MGDTTNDTAIRVTGYVPGIATKCWVPADKVEEGEPVWLVIGGQAMGKAQAGPADESGWRPVWWFSNGAKLPLCTCTYSEVCVHTSAPDGTHDCSGRLLVKWYFERPTETMMRFMANVEKFEADKAAGRQTAERYWSDERFDIPVTYPNSDEEFILTFQGGVACLNPSLNPSLNVADL